QQYVVLPILRALGWDDTNLASMEVLPEYAVKDGRVDYALKVGQKLALFLECKKWNESLDRYENQIVTYAVKAGMPIVGLTNGKIWRFYFSWIEGTSVSDRIFCETDIENRETAISDLEKYLLKSNVVSGEAKSNAEIALEEKEKTNSSESSPVDLKQKRADSVSNNQSEKRQGTGLSELGGEWTIERIRNSLPPEVTDYHRQSSEERCNLFYRAAAEVRNLIQEKEWRLDVNISKTRCSFSLQDRGIININTKRILGLTFTPKLGYRQSVDRNGEQVNSSKASTPPRLFVRIMEEEAQQLEREYGCKFCATGKDKTMDFVYYHIPENMSELFPVLEFAYKKHTGN
ncbi:MAG: hypothetical protein OXI63_20085, partial [Candidatus Poribacteria bacterium]|nr:hypothetical protein [Candidatus Poribacteria bacterium]